MSSFGNRFIGFSALVIIAAASLHAQVTNFGGNGSGWSLQGSGFSPSVTSNDLWLTNGGGNATSAFFDTKQGIGAFDVHFTYTNYTPFTGFNPGDGMTFTLQNSSPTAVGNGGGDLGYVGIPNATGIAINLWYYGGTGTGLANTSVPYNYHSVSPVDLLSNHPIDVNLGYNGSTLTETLKDPVANTTFTTSYTVNVASYVGGNKAYVGFTGGTGGAQANQHITNFSYTTVPESGSTAGLLFVAAVCLAGVELFRRRPAPVRSNC